MCTVFYLSCRKFIRILTSEPFDLRTLLTYFFSDCVEIYRRMERDLINSFPDHFCTRGALDGTF